MKKLWLWGMAVPGLILFLAASYVTNADKQRKTLAAQTSRVKAPAVARFPPTSKYTAILGRVVYDDGTPVTDYYVTTSPRMAYYGNPEIEAWRKERSVAGAKELKRLKRLGKSYEKNFAETLRLMSGPYGHAVTDAKGTYRLTHLTESSFNVALWDDPSGWTAPVVEIPTKYEMTVRAPDIILTRGSILRGRVFDQSTGQPLPGVEISSYGPHRPIYARGTKETLSDKQGRYALRVAPGTSMVWISGGEKWGTFSMNVRVNGKPYSTFVSVLKVKDSLYALGPPPDANLPGQFPFGKTPAPIRCILDGEVKSIRPDQTDWIEVKTKNGQNRKLDFGLRPTPLLNAKQRAAIKFFACSGSLQGDRAEQLTYEGSPFTSP